MTILVMLLFWGVMLTMIIVATCVSLIRLNQPAHDGHNRWQPPEDYLWETTR